MPWVRALRNAAQMFAQWHFSGADKILPTSPSDTQAEWWRTDINTNALMIVVRLATPLHGQFPPVNILPRI